MTERFRYPKNPNERKQYTNTWAGMVNELALSLLIRLGQGDKTQAWYGVKQMTGVDITGFNLASLRDHQRVTSSVDFLGNRLPEPGKTCYAVSQVYDTRRISIYRLGFFIAGSSNLQISPLCAQIADIELLFIDNNYPLGKLSEIARHLQEATQVQEVKISDSSNKANKISQQLIVTAKVKQFPFIVNQLRQHFNEFPDLGFDLSDGRRMRTYISRFSSKIVL